MMGMASDLRRAGSSENSAVPTALRALLAALPALKRRAIGSRPLRGLFFGGFLLCAALVLPAAAQTTAANPNNQSQQIPDAPSATKPPSPFPANTAPAPKTGDRQPAPPADENPPAEPTPPAEVKTVPAGGATRGDG